MRLGSTSLSATRPGAVRKYAAASSSSSSSSSAANFKNIDEYSYVRKRQFYSTTDSCMACEVSPDGSKFYILQGNPRRIRQYSLSTNFDISTAGSETSSFVPVVSSSGVTCFRFKPDGTRLFIANYYGGVRYHDLSTPWDISTIGTASSIRDITSGRCSGMVFHPDGTYIFWVDPYRDRVYRIELDTAWDPTGPIGSTTYSQLLDYSTTANMTIARDIFLNNDGTKLYIAGQASEKVVDYTLSPAYDISNFSGNADNTLSISAQENLALGLTFDPTGEHMYIAGAETPDGVTQWVRS